ncbi:unnamed protein product [Musa hybrid cultivar]
MHACMHTYTREEEERITNSRPLKCIILDKAALTNIDISGIESLKELKRTPDRRSLELVLANPVGEVSQKMSHSGTWDFFGPECFYMTVEEAIASTSYKI